MHQTLTMRFEFDGQRTVEVFPCRCGRTHRSDIDYDIEEYAEHNCFHRDLIGSSDWPGTVMCGECGAVFQVTEVSDAR